MVRFYVTQLHLCTCTLATGEWTTPSTSGTPPTPRQGHIVAVVGKKLFVHGGMAGQQILNDLYALNVGELMHYMSMYMYM